MRLNIHQKVLFLVVGAGLVTFLVLGIFSYFGRNLVQQDMAQMSLELGNKSASYTDELLSSELKDTLGELTKAKAAFINREMMITRENAEVLADAMTAITSHPENYLPKNQPDPRTQSVLNGQTYLIFAPDIRDKVPPEMMTEISIAANIAPLLEEMTRTYSKYNCTAFAGSEKGWYFCSRVVLGDDGTAHFNETIPFSHERIYEFDPRKRPWYVKAAAAQAPVVSDLYMTLTGAGEKSYQQIGASAPFYDAQGNFAGVVGLDYSNEDLYNFVNESGSSSFVVDDKGEILFASNMMIKGFFAAAAENIVAGKNEVIPVKLGGENFYLAYAPLPDVGWNFGMIVSEAEIFNSTQGTHNYFLKQTVDLQNNMRLKYSNLDKYFAVILFCLLLGLFLMSINLSRRFVKPIHELTDGVREIASGNMDKKLNIKTGDEIEHLATCFNAMTDELKIYMANLQKETAERERIATELDVAKDIQNGMLPKDFPAREDFELFATMTPAKEVGGDFYDFYFLDETHLAITVADVSGKGISAALFMVISKTILNNFAETFYKQNGLAPVVAAANEQLCANNEAMMFVTVFIGVLDLETGEFTYVNAGHNPPVIYHAQENHCDFMDVKKNFVMGPMDGIPFVEQKIILSKGDLIFIYTDGVTEALNVNDEEYLPDRLIKFMNETDCRADLQTLLKNIRGDVSKHVGEAAQSDDITMFALRFNGKP